MPDQMDQTSRHFAILMASTVYLKVQVTRLTLPDVAES